ncbi:MAG: DUF1499 domain-containing protein [Rhodospirillales bacterium]|nr:DUF1499 domain-containing protein [Rhodospirillales bacterium]
MLLLPLLASLLFPTCAGHGAAGLPVPPASAPLKIVRLATPNSALAGPAGFSPAPDLLTPLYHLPAPQLLMAIERVAAQEPRTYLQAAYPVDLQADYVARSRVFNFPDLVLVAAEPRGATDAALIIYSRSVYGSSDFGVNRARIIGWIAALDRRVAVPERR